MTDDPIVFDMINPIEGVPPAWVATTEPFTLVITEPEPGRYAASAMDASNMEAGRINLGDYHISLDVAQDACREFIRSKRQ